MVVGVPGTLEALPSPSGPFPRACRFSCHTEHFPKMQLGSRPPITALLAGEEKEKEREYELNLGDPSSPWTPHGEGLGELGVCNSNLY